MSFPNFEKKLTIVNWKNTCQIMRYIMCIHYNLLWWAKMHLYFFIDKVRPPFYNTNSGPHPKIGNCDVFSSSCSWDGGDESILLRSHFHLRWWWWGGGVVEGKGFMGSTSSHKMGWDFKLLNILDFVEISP